MILNSKNAHYNSLQSLIFYKRNINNISKVGIRDIWNLMNLMR